MSQQRTDLNRRIILASRPEGIPGPEHFRRDDQPPGTPAEGEFLVRNLYLSIDPAQRGWVNAAANYSEPVAIGAVMRALTVGRVERSAHPDFPEGQYLYGFFGWQDWCVATPGQVLRRVDPDIAPLSTAVGVLGLTGVTAWLALSELGQPRAGETVLVSTAAGAVGSIVGQIARHAGCRSIGLTGSDDKVAACMARYGYDSAINYRDCPDLAAAIGRTGADGIDVYFDNTGGGISDAVVGHMNNRGRIVQCGTAAFANWDPPPQGPRRERLVLVKRLRWSGFIIFDWMDSFDEAVRGLSGMLDAGTLVYDEDMETDIDAAPAALAALYRGENRGKKLIRLAAE